MARIELRDAIIRIKDGLAGTGAVNDMSIMAGDTTLSVNTLVLNTTDTDLVPIGAGFTIAGETGLPRHVVTARSPASMSPTTSITFTPALAAGVVDTAVITFTSCEIEIKVGDGNLTWTVNREFEYLLDRGDLDTVREGDQVPLDVTLDMVYEFITTGTDLVITPYDALNGIGGASEWVSSSADACEPYAVDIEVEHDPPCGSEESEITTLPDFRYDTLEADLSAATVVATGRCNTVLPTLERE